jgi:hypothetical protein
VHGGFPGMYGQSACHLWMHHCFWFFIVFPLILAGRNPQLPAGFSCIVKSF